jgi:hypothetical protein
LDQEQGMPLPDPERLAHHEAGHAVVQHWVARGRFRVTRVSLAADGSQIAGSSLLDREVNLGLYEFGLVVLAGIAAENRYFSDRPPPDGEIWGAVGDIDEWLDMARSSLESEARVELVTLNLLNRLSAFFADQSVWGTVGNLANLLLTDGTVEGTRLHAILERQALSP